MKTRRAAHLASLLAVAPGCPAAAEPFQTEFEAFEQQDRLAPPPQGAVLFLGSSSIRRWSSLAQDFPSIATINRGFGGSQIVDSIRHADRIVIPHNPSTLVFYAGENDLATGKSPEQVCKDFQLLVTRLRAALPGIRIAFISIKPSPCRANLLDPIQKTNALIRGWARTQPRLDFVDAFGPMLDGTGAPRSELFNEDGLHMNSKGYALWTGLLAPVLNPQGNPP